MRKIIVLLLLTFSAFSHAFVSVGIGSWAPYVNENKTGIADKRVSCLLKSAGINKVYKEYPWARVYRQIVGKQIDISYPWSRNKERDAEVLFSAAIFHDKEVLVYLQGRGVKITTLSDLKKYRVGALNGFSHIKFLEQNNITPIVQVGKEQQLLGMLYLDRIDVLPINASILERIIPTMTQEQVDRLEISSTNFMVSTMHIIARKDKKGQDIINKINKEIYKGTCGK